ncbi:MAG TPA: AgmX/PglI C-terminal domain-containing protein [Polyangia bacterium]|nr:AgmX/PglI C-terminal domain-containing protein [Polyangia bacterium]
MISILLLVAAGAPFGGCASTGPGPRAVVPPAAGETDVDPTRPPAGSKRLPSSIACEPTPPCTDCKLATGGAQPSPSGSLDKEVIRSIIRSHLAQARACYDAVAQTDPAAAGMLKLTFGIAPSGQVATSCLESSQLRDAVVERCMADIPLSWTFPPPEGGGWVVVTYPYLFTRDDQGGPPGKPQTR